MGYRQIIGKGHFWKLWSSQILSLIAQNLLNYTLIIRVSEIGHGSKLSNLAVALIIVAFGVPSILFAAVAGVYVDNWQRKRVLWISNLLRAGLLLLYPFVELHLVPVLILTFLVSTATQFFAPAEAASIPRLVRKKDLLTANALFVSTFYFTFVVGYVAAAPLLREFGSHASYFFAASLFAIAAVLATMLPYLGGKEVPSAKSPNLADSWHHTVRSLRENTQLIASNRSLYFPIIQLMFVQGIISVLLAFAPALSLALLKSPLQNASHYIVLPAAIGMLLGLGLVGRLTKLTPKLVLVKAGILSAGLGMFLIGLSGQLYRHGGFLPLSIEQVSLIVALLVFVIGLTNAMVSVAAQTILQENTEDEIRGKVFGALNMMLNLSLTVPVLFAAIAADVFSVTRVVSFVGAVVVAVAIAQIVWQARHPESPSHQLEHRAKNNSYKS